MFLWISRNLEQLSTSKLHAMGNVSSILTSQLIASNARDICLGVVLEPDKWIKDSGCSKHMTGNRKLFSTYKAYNRGNVIFGSNLRGNIIGKGQICHNKCRVTFSEHDSEITKNGKVIGYSQNSKAYIVLNKHTRKVKESLNVTFDETPPPSKTSPLVDDDLDEEEAIKFEMSMMGELNFFLGLQIKQIEDGIFFNQSMYIKEMLKKFGLEDSKPMKIPMSFDTKLMKDEELSAFVPAFKKLPKPLTLKRLSVSSNTLKDHVPACLCYMLYCNIHFERLNLVYYMAKRMEWVTKQARLILPYGMLLTRVFKFIMNEYLELYNESYILYDHVMTPLAAQLEQKPRRDRGTRRGRHSTSLSSTFDQPSSSHLNEDDNNGNDEGTSRASTPFPIRYLNSLTDQVPQVFQNPPNIDPHLEPFYTRQTEIINRQVQLRDEQRGRVRKIGKSLRRLWMNMKK
ncbi:pentatricopeptide repeat-containing protein [Tanacetum coccineum]